MSLRSIERLKRQPTNLLDDVLERRMLLYVLAAGAALAGASLSQAKVIFTPSDAVLKTNGFQGEVLHIDLNNDGVYDLSIVERLLDCTSTPFVLSAQGSRSSSAIGVMQGDDDLAPALKRGIAIGSQRPFRRSAYMAIGTFLGGPWAGVTKRYLAVRFTLNGEIHYGWVGFRSVNKELTAHLYGWAYETEPNKPIAAGDRGGMEDSAIARAAEPSSLQLLAMGHTGIANRQRRIAAQAIS